jgi:hypothetical protein
VNSVNRIEELFEKQQINSKGNEIVAVAFLYEQLPAPYVWVGPGIDPYAVVGEDNDTRQLRMVLSKTLPSFQPHIIPGHLKIDARTLIAGRPFQRGDQIKPSITNPALATMMADIIGANRLLKELEQETCSAIAVSGNSPATGEARIAIFVRYNPALDVMHPAGPTPTGIRPASETSKNPVVVRKGGFWKLIYGIGVALLILAFILFAVLLFDRSSVRSAGFVLYPVIFLAISILLMYLATRPQKMKK